MGEQQNKSVWWWWQRLLSVSLCLGIGFWLFLFIKAATLPAKISHFEFAESHRSSAVQLSIGRLESPQKADFTVQTILIKSTEAVNFDAAFNPNGRDLPSTLWNRVQCRVFSKAKNGRWMILDSGEQGADLGRFRYKFTKPGQYLVVVALPPANLQDLEGKTATYISKFLSGRDGTKARAVQVVWNAKSQSKVAPLPTPAPAPMPNPEQPPSPTPPEENTELGEMEPAEESQGASNPRDLTTKQAGVENSNGDSDTEKAENPQRKQPEIQGVPPRKGVSVVSVEDVEKFQMDGALPEIEIIYDTDDYPSLTSDEWDEFCKEHNMVLLLRPDAGYEKEFSRWPVVFPNGMRRDLPAMKIFKLYGRPCIPLEVFSQGIQMEAKMRVNDELAWSRCKGEKGFLLGNILVDTIRKTLEKESLSLQQLNGVKKITACVRVKRIGNDLEAVIEHRETTFKGDRK